MHEPAGLRSRSPSPSRRRYLFPEEGRKTSLVDGVRGRSSSPMKVVPPWIAGDRGAPTRLEKQAGVGLVGAMHVRDAPKIPRSGTSHCSQAVRGCLGEWALSPVRHSPQRACCPSKTVSPLRRTSRSPVREVSAWAAREQLFSESGAELKSSSGLVVVSRAGDAQPYLALRHSLPAAASLVAGPRVVVASTQPQARVIVGRGITANGTGNPREQVGDFQLFGQVDTKDLWLREPAPPVKPDVTLLAALRRTSFGSMLRNEPDRVDPVRSSGESRLKKWGLSDASTYEGTVNCDHDNDNVSDDSSQEANASS